MDNVQMKAEPTKISEEDRLGIENSFLKIQNLKAQIQIMDLMRKDGLEQIRQEQERMEKKRDELSMKYGVDITKATVAPDGTITSR